jgi:hypothetical protein
MPRQSSQFINLCLNPFSCCAFKTYTCHTFDTLVLAHIPIRPTETLLSTQNNTEKEPPKKKKLEDDDDGFSPAVQKKKK